jgi:CDP-diacylglycerol--glycerol-3-phosphate 3-phosphatidyltransferase
VPDRASSTPATHGWRRQVPNALTLLRLAMAVAFFATLGAALPAARSSEALAFWGNLAFALFIFGALTDVLDGWLARRWQATSVFGRVMDPFVDKVLVLGAFVYLAALPAIAVGPDHQVMDAGVAPWMVVVILGRELLVTSLRGWLEGLGFAFGADWWGKGKMLLQSVAVPLCLFVAVNEGPNDSDLWRSVRQIVVIATVATTAISAVPYVLRAIRTARGAA